MASLTCTVELDKKPGSGLTITIENPDDGITQTIQVDGTSIVLKVTKEKGESATSTITQTAEKVLIECKQFEVKAEESITMTSEKASRYESKDTLAVASKGDMSVKSSADLEASAVNVKATGSSSIGLGGGQQSKLELAAAAATLSGTKVEVKGKAQVAVAGPTVELKADAMLSAQSSGVATLKGSITNVQGTLVNLG